MLGEFPLEVAPHSRSDSDAAGVSVVIPAFNYEDYLPGSIESVLGQEYPLFEVIIVDDGSTDGTPAVAKRYSDDKRVRYIRQENAGLSAARNTGILAATHQFVAFLDADDRWRPDFLSSTMERFAALGSSFGLVATAHERIDSSGSVMTGPKIDSARDGEFTTRDFVMRNRPLASSIVIRKSAFERNGLFDISLRSSEDRDMWIRLTSAGHRFWFINRPLARIRRHPGNMSKNAVRMKCNSRAVLLKAWRGSAVPKRNLTFWLRAFSVHYVQIAWTHFDEGLRLRGLRYLFSSIAIWPIFGNPAEISEPPLFRIRAIAHFTARLLALR